MNASRININFAVYILLAGLAAFAEPHVCSIRFVRDMRAIKHDGRLEVIFNVDEKAGELTFLVTGCEFELNQKINDPKISEKMDLPPKVKLSGNEGVLADIMLKKIVYRKQDNQWRLKLDETAQNRVIGPLADVCTLFVQKDSWQKMILGCDVDARDEVLLKNAAPFRFYRRTLDGFPKEGVLRNYEISVVDTRKGKKVFSRLVLTNSVMSVESILQSDSFKKSKTALPDMGQ